VWLKKRTTALKQGGADMKLIIIYVIYKLFEQLDGEKHQWCLLPYKTAERCKIRLLTYLDDERKPPRA
jgi:hypothetical protein